MAALIGGLAVALHPVTDQFSQFLRLAFLRSPNYVAGVSGWTINQEGSAEFNNLTIRGTFQGTNFEINASGAFFYAAAPALGNLIESIAPASGTDRFGNNYVAGHAAYGALGGNFIAVSAGGTSGTLQMFHSAVVSGPWTASGSIGDDGSGNLLMKSANGVTQLTLLNGGATLIGGSASADILKITNQTAAPTSPITQIVAAAAADNSLGIQVSGDTVNRMAVDSNGQHSWGTGAAARDLTAQRNAGHLDVTASDGNTYSAERLTQVNTGQTITSVSPTLTALTGISASVASGVQYRFRLWVNYQGSAAAGAPLFRMTAPATSFSQGDFAFTPNSSTGATVIQGGSGLNVSQTGPTFQTAAQRLVWEGVFTPSAAGTLGVSGATNTSGDNLVINGATLDLFPVI